MKITFYLCLNSKQYCGTLILPHIALKFNMVMFWNRGHLGATSMVFWGEKDGRQYAYFTVALINHNACTQVVIFSLTVTRCKSTKAWKGPMRLTARCIARHPNSESRFNRSSICKPLDLRVVVGRHSNFLQSVDRSKVKRAFSGHSLTWSPACCNYAHATTHSASLKLFVPCDRN